MMKFGKEARMTKETFESLRTKWGIYASWTVWDSESGASMEWAEDDAFYKKVHTDYVFVALNCSDTKVDPYASAWKNFHSNDANIRKLIAALQGTQFQYCYITDVIKCYRESLSQNVTIYLKENPAVEEENIQKFKEEIACFGKPVLLALGRVTERILKRNHLTDEYKVVYVQHYASRNNAETYKRKVQEQLQAAGLW